LLKQMPTLDEIDIAVRQTRDMSYCVQIPGTDAADGRRTADTTLLDDDDAFEFVMGLPCLQELKLTSLLEVVGTTQSTLHLVQQVFQWEWDDLGVESGYSMSETPC
jgi:hypothetical protein